MRLSPLEEARRTVDKEACLECTEGRAVDLPSSSSEDNGSSRAVVNDSVRELSVVVLENVRSTSEGRIAFGREAGCGGVTSGVGGLRWSGGVAGPLDETSFGVLRLLSAIVGLEGRAEWLLEDVREWFGGVGGSSGPEPILPA